MTHDWVISPWVAGLLWSAALQLLHQHLAAPSQGVTNLPEGAAAAQRAVTVLRRGNRKLSQHLMKTLTISCWGSSDYKGCSPRSCWCPTGGHSLLLIIHINLSALYARSCWPSNNELGIIELVWGTSEKCLNWPRSTQQSRRPRSLPAVLPARWLPPCCVVCRPHPLLRPSAAPPPYSG